MRLLEDATSLNTAGDPYAIAHPPRKLRQTRLGWLPASNWYRNKYGQEAEITIISIDKDGSPIQGGLDPFEKSSSGLPCLTAMSPNGEVFAVADSDGKLDVRQAATGGKYGEILHCEHTHGAHIVIWMYFVDESSLVVEYECGQVHNHRLDEHPPLIGPNAIHSLPSSRSPNTFSSCSLDRSTILRLTKLENSNRGNDRDPDIAESEAHFDGVVVHPGELLSVWILDCGSWQNPPRVLPPFDISEECLLDPRSLAISHNNRYAAVVLLEYDGGQHDTRRSVHFWCIREMEYLGFRDVRGPKWESWVPANHFDNDGEGRPVLVPRNDVTRPVGVDLVVDVYHPNDVRLREADSLRQMLPPPDGVFFVVHGGQTLSVHHSTSAVAFTCRVADVERQPREFSHGISMVSCEALALFVREVVRGLQATCGGIPLDAISALDRTSVALAACASISAAHHLAAAIVPSSARDVVFAARDIAFAARDVVFAARDITFATRGLAFTDVAFIARAAISDAFVAASDVAFAARAAASDVLVAGAVHASFDAARAALDAARITSGAPNADVAIQCSGILKGKEIFQIPHHLVLPLLVHPRSRSHLRYQSSGSSVVLGGYPCHRNKWVPVCVLHFQRPTQLDSVT